jgi:hypothetical protein
MKKEIVMKKEWEERRKRKQRICIFHLSSSAGDMANELRSIVTHHPWRLKFIDRVTWLTNLSH